MGLQKGYDKKSDEAVGMRALLSYEGLAFRMRALLSYEGLGINFQYLCLAWLGFGGWGGKKSDEAGLQKG